MRSLPAQITSLVGRDQDAAETRDLLMHATERLVTLTGLGGGGKTRLALRVAADARAFFPDGVCLVELAAARPLGELPGDSLTYVEKPAYDQLLEAVRSRLSEAELGAAWGAGSAMSLDQAVEFAITLARPNVGHDSWAAKQRPL